MLLEVPAEPSCQLPKDSLGVGRRLVVGDDFMGVSPLWRGEQDLLQNFRSEGSSDYLNPGGLGNTGPWGGHPRLVQQHRALCTTSLLC